MSQNHQHTEDSDSQHIEELVFRCLEAEDFDEELARVCAAHPAVAERVRRVAERLHAEGMLGEDATTHAAPSTRVDTEMPRELGDFQLLRRLGAGGMGVVYLAEERALGRKVALKVVRPEQLYFPGSRERFRREVEAIARLQHPGIVTIYSFGEANAIPYFSMEYVQGRSLASVISGLRGRDPARLRSADGLHAASTDDPESSHTGGPTTTRGSPAPQDSWVLGSLKVLRGVADALVHAHAQGVLHRDVKPSNIILGADGRPRLLDFGLARLENAQELTKSTAELGSLPYMPPEVVSGRVAAPSAALDVYSLGVTMYELLTLRSPFLCPRPEQTRERIVQGTCAPMRELNPAVSWEVQTVCATAMELSPTRRYRDMQVFLQDLDNLLARRPIVARPSGPVLRACRWVQRHPTSSVAIAMASLLMVAALAFGVWQHQVATAAEQTSYELGLTAADSRLVERRTLEAKRSLDLCPPQLRGFEWFHLDLRADSSDRTYRGHDREVMSIDCHPRDPILVSGSTDGTVRLWNTDTGEARVLLTLSQTERSPEAHWVRIVRFSSDGNSILVGANDRLIRRLRPDGTSLGVVGEHSSEISSLAVDPTGRFLASGSSRGEIRLYDASGKALAELRAATLVPSSPFTAPERPVQDLVFSADGKRLYAGHMAELLVFDTEARRLERTMQHAKRDWISMIQPLLDGRHVVSGGIFGNLSQWDVTTGKRVRVSEFKFAKGVNAVGLARGGTQLVLGGADGVVAFCDALGLTAGHVLLGHQGSVHAISIAADRRSFFTCSRDYTIRRWRVDSRPAARILGTHRGLVRTLEVSADGKQAFSGGSDGTLRAWDIGSGAVRELFDTDRDKVHHTSLSPDGRRLAVAADRMRVLDLGSGGTRILESVPTESKHIAWFPDSRHVLVAGDDGRVSIADADTDRLLATDQELVGKPAHEAQIRVVGVCPWNGVPVVTNGAGLVRCFAPNALDQRRNLTRFPHGIGALLFDSERRVVVVASFGGAIRFLDVETGRQVQPDAQWDLQVINAMALGAGTHRRLATASMGDEIQVWEYPSMRRLLLLRGHRRGVFALQFTPDGRRLLSGSWDKTVRVWETERR
ncbi:MAG: protein kinase [Planctomycetes bacterium]|nr:protein kinase [Planctomycetota bacterium]MCB9871243.1 protein kinase [Planctomycetota bacterium]